MRRTFPPRRSGTWRRAAICNGASRLFFLGKPERVRRTWQRGWRSLPVVRENEYGSRRRRRREPYSFSLTTGSDRQPRCQVRLTRSGFPKKNNRLAPLQIAAFRQVPDLRGGKVRRIAERKFLQRFHLGEMGILDPPRYGVLMAVFHFRSQQRFQITQMPLLLLDRFFGHRQKLPSHRRELQLFGILPNRGLLYGNRRFQLRSLSY